MRCSVLLVLLLFAGCKAPKYSYKESEPVIQKEEGTIAFFTFQAFKDNTGTVITLLDRKKVQGVLKDSGSESHAPHRLTIYQLTRDKQVITTLSIPHPLRERVELYAEGRPIEAKEIEKDKSEFFIRTMLAPQTAYLRIEESINNTKVRTTDIEL